jgi:hypothetical protein
VTKDPRGTDGGGSYSALGGDKTSANRNQLHPIDVSNGGDNPRR